MQPSEAARAAQYSENTIDSLGMNVMGSSGVQQLMTDMLTEYTASGITAKRLVEKTKEWLDAKEEVIVEGEVVDHKPDYRTQLKAGEMIRRDMKLWEQTQQAPTQNVFIFSQEVAEAAAQILRDKL